jgi:hypothetical protein
MSPLEPIGRIEPRTEPVAPVGRSGRVRPDEDGRDEHREQRPRDQKPPEKRPRPQRVDVRG